LKHGLIGIEAVAMADSPTLIAEGGTGKHTPDRLQHACPEGASAQIDYSTPARKGPSKYLHSAVD
jgi:hypothetical protein